MKKFKQILLIIGMVLLPSLCFADGDLVPAWEATMTQMGSTGSGASIVGAASGTSLVGTVDMSGYYNCELTLVLHEVGHSATGSAGVSVYTSGTTDSIPVFQWNVDTTSFANYQTKGDVSTGITKVFYIENVYNITVGACKNTAADLWSVWSYYRRMKGRWVSD